MARNPAISDLDFACRPADLAGASVWSRLITCLVSPKHLSGLTRAPVPVEQAIDRL